MASPCAMLGRCLHSGPLFQGTERVDTAALTADSVGSRLSSRTVFRLMEQALERTSCDPPISKRAPPEPTRRSWLAVTFSALTRPTTWQSFECGAAFCG